jgi:hypothetical protein
MVGRLLSLAGFAYPNQAGFPNLQGEYFPADPSPYSLTPDIHTLTNLISGPTPLHPIALLHAITLAF